MRRRYPVLLLALGSVTCGGPTDPGDFGLLVTVTLSAVQVPRGDTVRVTVNAENVTGRPLDLGFLGPCSVSFEVVNGQGDVVAPIPAVCPLIQWVPTLAPGSAIGATFDWRGERQWGTGDYVAPRSYEVRGVLDTQSGLVRGQPIALRLIGAK